jgi:hypothetical protein
VHRSEVGCAHIETADEFGLISPFGSQQRQRGSACIGQGWHHRSKPEDVVRDSYTLEFLGIQEDYRYSETLLEQRIIDNLQMFLLEMEQRRCKSNPTNLFKINQIE